LIMASLGLVQLFLRKHALFLDRGRAVGRTGGGRARTQATGGAGGEEGPPLVKEKVQALVQLFSR